MKTPQEPHQPLLTFYAEKVQKLEDEIERLKGFLDDAAIELDRRGDEMGNEIERLKEIIDDLATDLDIAKGRERERCAQLAEEHWIGQGPMTNLCKEIAAAIRALADDKERD